MLPKSFIITFCYISVLNWRNLKKCCLNKCLCFWRPNDNDPPHPKKTLATCQTCLHLYDIFLGALPKSFWQVACWTWWEIKEYIQKGKQRFATPLRLWQYVLGLITYYEEVHTAIALSNKVLFCLYLILFKVRNSLGKSCAHKTWYFPIPINFAAKIFELCLENKFKKANYFSLIACECEPLAILWLWKGLKVHSNYMIFFRQLFIDSFIVWEILKSKKERS